MNELKTFRMWCQKVLPLVYDNSLSYYEVLCKVVDYINKLIENGTIIGDELEKIKSDLAYVKDKIEHFDTEVIEKYLEEHVAKMIFVEINDDGYIVYYIPDSWNEIEFNTTGLDITIPNVEYGHLVLSY